jgi:thymidylate kinase
MPHKIIFEGAELSGKSYLMSQIYNHLEPKYNSGGKILDGCHWFNCDVGLYGTEHGQIVVNKYLELLENLADLNIILEKFHITEYVYQKLYNNQEYDFSNIEDRLKKLDAKIILTSFQEDEELIKKRLQDRINLYPHYAKIAQQPAEYIKQQQEYIDIIKQSKLDYLVVDSSELPNQKLVAKILKFLGEE